MTCRSSFRFIISLDEGDDAQVIFETLNGRGAELHATDLIRNFIFMRADKENADGGALCDALWSPFEGSFWNEEQRRGRLRKPRLEWFLQGALQAELADNAILCVQTIGTKKRSRSAAARCLRSRTGFGAALKGLLVRVKAY